MRTKILCLILATIATVALLSSCRVANNGGGGNGTTPVAEKNTVFSKEVSVTLVKGTGAKDLNGLSSWMYDLTGNITTIITGDVTKSGNEIIFGNTDREVSKKALEKLDTYVRRGTIEFEDEGKNIDRLGVFVVYAEGGDVAMVWNNNNIADSAAEYFLENYMNEPTLILEDGYVYYEIFDFIEFMEIAEKKQREEYLKEIEKQYDAEVAKAVDDLWSIYDDRYVLWLADLYDPGEYDEDGNPLGGGFYYSNSARDNDGYAIDLESTAQVLSFLTASGMLPETSSALRTYIPEKMQKEMVAFALSCQSSVDGCFYHPQWGMNIQESRKTRDHGWGLDILGAFNAKPYWNSDLGAKGVYGDAPGYEIDIDDYLAQLNTPTALTGRLSGASVASVSKVVATAGGEWTGSSMFKNLDSWIKYLEAWESKIRTNSYGIGNTVSGLATQAKNREKMALDNGELFDNDGDGYADGGYREMFEYYFNKWMLPENGLWESGTVEDGTITYGAINGLMKTIGAYNGFGFKHPYAEKAIESAVFIATLEGKDVMGDDAANSVDVFNPFVAIELTLNNMEKYGSAEEAANIQSIIQSNAAEIINITRVKLVDFKKDDGSFGYTKTTSPSSSQGAPVSVPYTVEGDVNGGGIASNGTLRYIRRIFGIEMPLFWRSDFYKFIERASGNSTVLKGEGEILPASVITFDDDASAPSSLIDNMREGHITIKEDPRAEKGGNVLEFVTYPGGGSSFALNPGGASATHSLVLEWEMCFEDVQYFNGTLFQIKLGSSYMFTCGVTSAGRMVLADSSSVSSPLTSSYSVVEADPYEWNKIRLEYYVVDDEKGETLTKFYFNDELRGVSTNYMGKETAGNLPKMSYNAATFSALAATNMTVLFDDIYATKSEQKYVDEMIYNPDRIKDFEDAELGTAMPANVTSAKGEIVAVTDNGNSVKALLLDGANKNAAIKFTTASATVNAYVIDTDMRIDADAAGVAVRLYMTDYMSASRAIAAYEIETYYDGEILKAKITEFDLEGNRGETFDGIPVGEWFSLRIEFYLYRYLAGDCSKIYVNDDLIGIGSVYGGIDTISKRYNYFYAVTASDVQLYLDNVISERVYIEYRDADGNAVADPDIELPRGGESSSVPAGSDHNGRFDFEDQELGTPNVQGLTTKVNSAEYGNNMDIATDPKNAANKVLLYRVMQASNGLANSMVFTASDNSPASANCHVLEFDMLVTDFDTDGSLQISIFGKYGNNDIRIFSTNCSANMSKGTFTISGKTEDVAWPGSIVAATPIKGWVNVRFEYYKDQGIMQVYYDGEYRGESNFVWNEENKGASMTHATFYTTSSCDCEMYFDNVILESVKKTYVKGTAPASGTPAGSEKDEIGQGGSSDDPSGGDVPVIPDLEDNYTGYNDFETSQVGTFAVPGIGLVKSTSTSASAMVLETEREGAVTRALKYYAKGSQNRLRITIKENEEQTSDMFSVSWDMNFSDVAKNSTYQIAFGSNGQLPTYMLQMNVTTAGVVSIRDISSTNTSVSNYRSTFIADLSAGWHNIRIDYSKLGGICVANIWIDGYFILTSHNYYDYYGNLTAPKDIHDLITISSTSNVDANMWLDNISANYVESIEEPPVYDGVLDFEDEELDETRMLGFASSFNNDAGFAKVVKDPRDETKKVLAFYAYGTKNYIQSEAVGTESGARDKMIISWDMSFTDIGAASTYQMSLGYDGSDRTYMLQMTVSKNGNVKLTDISSTNSSVQKTTAIVSGLEAGWHNLRVEMEIVEGKFTANIYIDDNFVVTSHNYYDYSASLTAPRAFGDYMRISTTGGTDLTMLIDNVSTKFVDEIAEPPVYEGFNDFEYYEVDKTFVLGTTYALSNGTFSVQNDPLAATNKALEFYTSGSGNSVAFEIYGEKSNSVVFEFDIMFTEVAAESHYQLSIGGSYLLQITPLAKGTFSVIDRNDVTTWGGEGKEYYRSMSFTSGAPLSNGSWHKIRVEYSIVDGGCVANVYIDGNLAGTSDHFYNYGGTGTEPNAIGDTVSFRSTGGCNAVVWIDNVTAKYAE